MLGKRLLILRVVLGIFTLLVLCGVLSSLSTTTSVTASLSRSVNAALSSKRVIAVMIENHEDARAYQAGLSNALLVEEFLVEGMISRFAAVFDTANFPSRIGPVRSLRSYFVDGLLPGVTRVIHAGGSPDALARTDIERVNILATGAGERDEEIPAPHNLFLTEEDHSALFDPLPPKTPWPPYAVGPVQGTESAREVFVNFHNPRNDVTYVYRRATDSFIRSSGETAKQATPRNLLFLQMPITAIGEHGRLTIPVAGKGKALLFRAGTILEGKWKKSSAREAFTFETSDGKTLNFGVGQTWITVLPDLGRVTWK